MEAIFRKACLILIMLFVLSACSYRKFHDYATDNRNQNYRDVMTLTGTSFENLNLPPDYDIKQFEGMTLNFVVENNPYATILTHESEEFSEVTGINVKVRPMDYDTLVQKVNLDFISREGKYQLVYVDPYQTLNRFHDCLEVLNEYVENPDIPGIKGMPDDFFTNQVLVCSYFEREDEIYSIPFDSTTMILYYRKDIFDKYRSAFYEEMGYDWTPGGDDFTWDRYMEAARWISQYVPDSEVKYGSGHMAQEHNSIFCDFSNILAAYGGDYFSDPYINSLGLKTFKKNLTRDSDFIQALDMYKKIVGASAPNSVNWNWADVASAFRTGEIAMMPNWDENYTYVEDKEISKVYGKVGYAILPFGDTRSANIYGGSGVGINKFAADEEKQAAWLYITWATSLDMQLKVLNHQRCLENDFHFMDARFSMVTVTVNTGGNPDNPELENLEQTGQAVANIIIDQLGDRDIDYLVTGR